MISDANVDEQLVERLTERFLESDELMRYL